MTLNGMDRFNCNIMCIITSISERHAFHCLETVIDLQSIKIKRNIGRSSSEIICLQDEETVKEVKAKLNGKPEATVVFGERQTNHLLCELRKENWKP